MLRKLLCFYLSLTLIVIGFVQSAGAAFVPSEVTLNIKNENLNKIQSFLERKIVSQRLKDFGFTEKEIIDRLNALDEKSIHSLALKIDEIKVAGDAGAAVVLALVIIALVVLIINLTGHKVVVK